MNVKKAIDYIEQMISDCENRSDQLNDWEAGFIDSISRTVGKGYGLTKNQQECLYKIWDKVTENG